LGRIVTIALWRANNKPPVELVVANLNGFTELVIILTNPEGKKKVTEEAKCNTLKKIAIVTKTTEQNL